MAKIRRAQSQDLDQLAEMRALLWPDTSAKAHREEVAEALLTNMSGTLPMAILVAEGDDGQLIGFLEVGMRSHADGCDPKRPVGFVEGWFVREDFRKRGVGTALMRSATGWAHSQGCAEMASDALIDNDASLKAHAALGFEVVDRCVHFRKTI
jgi:aminoglycoside 6'-N-acetyltransferase I